MIKTNELKGLIVSRGMTQKNIADEIGISPKTFYVKMKRGIFNSNEIEAMINTLNIQEPDKIFFSSVSLDR